VRKIRIAISCITVALLLGVPSRAGILLAPTSGGPPPSGWAFVQTNGFQTCGAVTTCDANLTGTVAGNFIVATIETVQGTTTPATITSVTTNSTPANCTHATATNAANTTGVGGNAIVTDIYFCPNIAGQ
jgi:hypothetical protein